MSVSLYSDPEFYRAYRSAIDPMDASTFRRIRSLLEDVVVLNLQVEYVHVLRPSFYTVNRPLSSWDVRDGLEYETEHSGFTRLDGRIVDTRILTASNDLYQTLGVVGMVGIATQPSSPIHSLWVMSAENGAHWMLEHDEGNPITAHEVEALEVDLLKTLDQTV